GNSSNGVQFNNGFGGEVAFNVIYGNAANGVNYDGNSSLIHDNVIHDNGQFGIYVKSGVNHQVYNNQVYNNAGGDVKIVGTVATAQHTYYVDSANGNNAYTIDQAQSIVTPWQSIKAALAAALPGDTIIVLPGTYNENVESKLDAVSGSPITIRAATPGTAIVQPPPGANGFYISHHYYTIDGFVVTGGLNGIQLGPHDGNSDQAIYGLIANNNRVYGNSAV